MKLQKKFDELFMDRTCDLTFNMTEEELLQYEHGKEKYDELYQAILGIVPDNGKNILFELDTVIGNFQTLLTNCAYKLGIKDSFELLNGIKIFGVKLLIDVNKK